jgi:hypothetical protein
MNIALTKTIETTSLGLRGSRGTCLTTSKRYKSFPTNG